MINFDNGSTVLKRMLKYLPLEWSTISGFIRVGFSLACNYKTRVELIRVHHSSLMPNIIYYKQ
jgi:hypothetical protein